MQTLCLHCATKMQTLRLHCAVPMQTLRLCCPALQWPSARRLTITHNETHKGGRAAEGRSPTFVAAASTAPIIWVIVSRQAQEELMQILIGNARICISCQSFYIPLVGSLELFNQRIKLVLHPYPPYPAFLFCTRAGVTRRL